jgi:hypothetical protein
MAPVALVIPPGLGEVTRKGFDGINGLCIVDHAADTTAISQIGFDSKMLGIMFRNSRDRSTWLWFTIRQKIIKLFTTGLIPETGPSPAQNWETTAVITVFGLSGDLHPSNRPISTSPAAGLQALELLNSMLRLT